MFRGTRAARNKFADMASKFAEKAKEAGGGAGGAEGGGRSPVVPVLAATAAVGVGTLYYFARNIMFDVDAGFRALKFNRVGGISEHVHSEGTHFMIPWFERPILFDIKTRPKEMQSFTGTRDLQTTNIRLRMLFRPDPTRLSEIYRRLGLDYDEIALKALSNEVLKAVVARFSAQEMITNRDSASRQIREELTRRAKDFGIFIDDVAITHLRFSKDFEKAVESKQVAQQQADRAKYMVQKAEEEKKGTIIRAQAQAKEIELISNAMKNRPGYIELLRIDNAKDIAVSLAQSSNKIILSADSLMLNLFDGK